MFFFYNLILIISSVLLGPAIIVRVLATPKHRYGILERLGFIRRRMLRKRGEKPLIWIHAVSVGEVLAASALIAAVRHQFPSFRLLISTTTLTGHRICLDKVATDDDIVIFFPLDYPFVVKKVLKKISPCLVIIIETEIWPNFMSETAKKGIPVILLNGRISDSSYKGYMKYRFFIRPVLQKFLSFSMQTRDDLRRIIDIGAPEQKVRVTGSLKYDTAMVELPVHETIHKLQKKLGLDSAQKPVIIGGSTHQGEEEILADIFTKLKNKFSDLILILAPRHPERVPKIEQTLKARGYSCDLWSKLDSASPPSAPIIIIDTLGELANLYAVATVVFIGKSLTEKGGHNPIEPARLKKPVVFGPHMDNFREPARLLLQNGGAIMVQNQDELTQAFLNLLSKDDMRDEMSGKAYKAVTSRTGALEQSLALVRQALVRKNPDK